MAFYIKVTDLSMRDAETHGRSTLLSNLKDRVEKTQHLTGFEFFPPTPFLKKGLGRNLRLIGYHVPIGDDELILFLRVLTRDSNDYKYFLENWQRNTDLVTIRFQPYSDEQLQQIYSDLTMVPPPPPPPKPSADELGWLYEVFFPEETDDDLIVLETEEWVREMRDPKNREFLALYHQMLEQMNLSQLHAATGNTDVDIYWGSNNLRGIAYLYRQDLNRLLLLEPLHHPDRTNALVRRHIERLGRIGDDQHELARIAARSYPFLMVLDQDAWLAIQKDEEANLALSPEEAEVLDSIRRMGAKGQLGYPLFINGRAGSGKSTMLQYLAADYLDFGLRHDVSRQLFYMTSSQDLLERARRIVRSILITHHERLLQGTHESSKVDEAVKRCFKVFHDFLYSFLPEDLQEKLPRDKYVDYAQFRRLWEREFATRPEARRMLPDVAWHIIRSYIKGIRSSHDDELTPEEFRALPRRRRSVSHQTYQQVYERAWCSWYKRLCNDKNYWDDQDLAAWVLENNVARKIDCAAIFCDEAQDFTPLELDIIFQLSLFGRRSLQPEQLRRVPIVFAGDPLQTINPTGFRWDAVQADFYDRFCAVLDPHRRARIDITYKELSFNYRSNPGIVRFCNLIQLARAALLDASAIRPQEAWWVDEPIQTVWFAADNEATKQGLRQRQDFVKLVNCEAGEENDYVDGDEILRSTHEEAEGIYRNVFSPMRAKGLEFPAVVLYRFGETAPRDFEKLLQGEVNLNEPEARLPYEYFFNRLYVAASRAKGQLVIVDSDRALRQFWQFATDTEVVDRLIEKAGGQDRWKGHIAHPVKGTEKWWDGEKIDPRKQGEDYMREGQAKRDPYLLRQAALAYRSAGDECAAGKCLALAHEMEGNFGKAGDKYRELGLFGDAFRCYWIGEEWSRLCKLAAENSDYASRLESRAADFMAQRQTLPKTFLEKLIAAAREDAWLQQVHTDSTWRGVIDEVAKLLQKAKGDQDLPWAGLWDAFNRFRTAGIRINLDHLAMIAYRAGKLGEAIRLWEKSKDTKRGEYLRAKAQITPFPENLVWFARLGDHSEILRQWNENRAEVSSIGQLDETVIRTVVDAAIEQNNTLLAIELLEYLPAEKERIAKVLRMAVERANTDLVTRSSVLAARMFVRTGDWDAAIVAAENADFSKLLEGQSDGLRNMLLASGGVKTVFQAVVEELAVSEKLAKETARRQVPVTEFLNRHFISKGCLSTDLHGLFPEVIGAAIERSGKIIDAVKFYENLQSSPSPEVQRFAAERLVRNLERYAEYFRSVGNKAGARDKELRAQRIRRQANLGDREISEYPAVHPGIAQAEPTKWILGPLEILLSRAHKRLRIEHKERFETVTVDCREGILLGDATFSEAKSRVGELAAWEITGWNVRVALVDEGIFKGVIIEAGKERFECPMGKMNN